MNDYMIAFDVGGLFVKAAVLNPDGRLCKDTTAIYPSKSKEPKDVLLDHFTSMIRQQINQIPQKRFRISGIGFAFPGPFDYENGISYMRGIDKFEHIYGVNLRLELTRKLMAVPVLREKLSPDFRIAFENDASLFALGTLLSETLPVYRKSICFTIGTGTGSAFIENGVLVKEREDVPENGWVYNDPFGESIVDEYISKRGILRLAREIGIAGEPEVKELAEKAFAGDPQAAEVFSRFGENMGTMCLPYVRRFRPEALIIGGQIAKSHALFEPEFLRKLEGENVAVHFVDQTSLSTFVGVSKLLEFTGSETKKSV